MQDFSEVELAGLETGDLLVRSKWAGGAISRRERGRAVGYRLLVGALAGPARAPVLSKFLRSQAAQARSVDDARVLNQNTLQIGQNLHWLAEGEGFEPLEAPNDA